MRLDEAPIVVQSSALFDYQWNITTYDRALRDGGRAVSRRRPIQEKALVLDVFADTQEEHDEALDRLHDVTDYDVCTLSPGRLWINDQYIRCFVYVSVKTLDRDWTTYTVVGLTLRAVSPAWTAEQTVTRLPVAAESADGSGKHYEGKYSYRYTEGNDACRFYNDTHSPAPMIIKIFGPCSAPSVYIGGNEYAINGDIESGEYVMIDQVEKHITKVAANGVKSNLFNRRKKSVDNFLYAPVGDIGITCSGDFACEVTFLTQRSEPKRSLRSLNE